MSLLLKAFPHGRPRRPRALDRPRTTAVLALAAALVVVVLPVGGVAQAKQKPHHHAQHSTHHRVHHAAHHRKAHAGAKRVKAARAHKKKKPRPPRIVGQPARNYAIPQGSFFSFPNKGKKARHAIRDRVLATIQSVWGGPRDAYGAPRPGNGVIRMATWSFDDWDVARALVAAKKRGVSVQIVGAKKANRGHASWAWLRKKLGPQLFRPRYPATNTMWSFARQCRGACRGLFGTAHSKYFLFDNVGARHVRHITVQTSMNLTTFAFSGQWNQAQVTYSPAVWNDFYVIFRQSRLNKPVAQPYRVKRYGYLVDYFFPRYGVTPATDPVSSILNGIKSCYGATAGGTGRTRINIIQYAIYGDRGEWISRRLRYLWEHGCDVAIIYSVASRPVLSILRSGSGRGAIPMRQSVITNGYGIITSYNHSKWMTIVGRWGTKPDAYVTFSGSANWANLALGDDEQMQRIDGRGTAAAHLSNFAATWRQSSSHMPGYGVLPSITGRTIPFFARDVPETAPTWGRGVFKYMTPD